MPPEVAEVAADGGVTELGPGPGLLAAIGLLTDMPVLPSLTPAVSHCEELGHCDLMVKQKSVFGHRDFGSVFATTSEVCVASLGFAIFQHFTAVLTDNGLWEQPKLLA